MHLQGAYLSSLNFRALLIFAQQKCAIIKRSQKRYFRTENEKIIGQKQRITLQCVSTKKNQKQEVAPPRLLGTRE